jgi:hypothetical protein
VTWAARCVLCEKAIAQGSKTADEAQDALDEHLATDHGIEVES